MGDLLLLAGVAGLFGTALLLVACLRLESAASFALGVFIVAWGLAVVETMALSAVEAWTRGAMLGAIGAGLIAAAAAWVALGRPSPPDPLPVLSTLGRGLRDPIVAMLAAASALSGAYLLVVAVAIPPLDIDVLGYHLPRIVLWMQQDAVGAIPNTPGSNLDGNPPGAEIAKALTMLLAETDRYVGLFQVACLAIGALAVAQVARRLGLEVPGALLGGLLFATFPIVALQAPTPLNDLAVATALIVACAFALGGSRGELVLCALAVALALTTKVSGILGLPSVAALALAATPPGRGLRVVAAGAAGCVVGSWWYLLNLERTGSWDGGLAADYGQTPSRAPDEIVLRLERYGLQTLDLAGVVGRDRWLFPIVATALLVVATTLWRRRRTEAIALAAAAPLVALAPWIVDWAHVAAVRAVARSWLELGRGDLLSSFPMRAEARPFPGETWFGPGFAVLCLVAAVVILRTTVGRARVALLVAVVGAPGLLYLVNATAFVYDGARGRFFVTAGALAATGLGVVIRVRPVAWAATVIATLTLVLSLIHFHARPMGIELLEPIADPVLWGEPRWRAQAALAPTPDALRSGALLERVIPDDAVVAVDTGTFSPLYPLQGSGPWRTIRFVGADGAIPSDARFLAVSPDRALVPEPDEWRRVRGVTTWRLYERTRERRG